MLVWHQLNGGALFIAWFRRYHPTAEKKYRIFGLILYDNYTLSDPIFISNHNPLTLILSIQEQGPLHTRVITNSVTWLDVFLAMIWTLSNLCLCRVWMLVWLAWIKIWNDCVLMTVPRLRRNTVPVEMSIDDSWTVKSVDTVPNCFLMRTISNFKLSRVKEG